MCFQSFTIKSWHYGRLRFPVPKLSITCSLPSPMWPCRLRSSKSSSVTSPFRLGGKRSVLNTRTGDEGSVGTVTTASYQFCDGCSMYIKHFPIMLTQSSRLLRSYFNLIAMHHIELCDRTANHLESHEFSYATFHNTMRSDESFSRMRLG